MPDQSKNQVPEITVYDLKRRIDEDNCPFILDVREQWEYDVANLKGYLIPLKKLPERLEELEQYQEDDLIVVHCQSGGRSAKAVKLLLSKGYSNAKNLRGGIAEWGKHIDEDISPH